MCFIRWAVGTSPSTRGSLRRCCLVLPLLCCPAKSAELSSVAVADDDGDPLLERKSSCRSHVVSSQLLDSLACRQTDAASAPFLFGATLFSEFFWLIKLFFQIFESLAGLLCLSLCGVTVLV